MGKRIKEIREELEKTNRDAGAPVLKELPGGEGFIPSFQNELMERSGLWQFLQLWDGRQFMEELKKDKEKRI